MAKKEKIELTPEEKAAKKLRHSNGWVRFWAIVVALALTAGVYGLADSKAGKAADEAAKANASASSSTGNKTSTGSSSSSSSSGSSSSGASTGTSEQTTAASAATGSDTAAAGSNTAAKPGEKTPAEIVEYYNAAVLKVKKESTGAHVQCTNEAKNLQVGMFSSIAQKLVDQFLKPGEWDTEPKGFPPENSDTCAVQLDWLSKTEYKEEGNNVIVKLYLNAEDGNPQPGSSNHGKTIPTMKDEDIYDAINGTGLLKLNSFVTSYQDCTAEITVDKASGKITTATYYRSIVANADTNLMKGIAGTINSTYVYTVNW